MFEGVWGPLPAKQRLAAEGWPYESAIGIKTQPNGEVKGPKQVAATPTIFQKTGPIGITVSNAHDIVALGVHRGCGRDVPPQA
jgi:hypothetical protein